MDNPTNVVTDQLIARLREQAERLFGNEGRVENLSPPSNPQVQPSFEAHTPPVTHPEEVDEIIGTPIKV